MKNVLYGAVMASLVLCGCCAECRYYNTEPACQKAKLVCDKVAAEKAATGKNAKGSALQKSLNDECECAKQGCREVLIQKGLLKKPKQ